MGKDGQILDKESSFSISIYGSNVAKLGWLAKLFPTDSDETNSQSYLSKPFPLLILSSTFEEQTNFLVKGISDIWVSRLGKWASYPVTSTFEGGSGQFGRQRCKYGGSADISIRLECM